MDMLSTAGHERVEVGHVTKASASSVAIAIERPCTDAESAGCGDECTCQRLPGGGKQVLRLRAPGEKLHLGDRVRVHVFDIRPWVLGLLLFGCPVLVMLAAGGVTQVLAPESFTPPLAAAFGVASLILGLALGAALTRRLQRRYPVRVVTIPDGDNAGEKPDIVEGVRA